ncbi:hypothetical protein AMTR_s00108p00150170 [Amborella trichopoda]|uniref:Uncharacterized protein n=1 Tax=Amborella trichopoda TaxID=13333 RepID=W1NXF4_AMBTC|nr:hypothetical protein AMTR_s00108p00150170 [Amborella trichopoda]
MRMCDPPKAILSQEEENSCKATTHGTQKSIMGDGVILSQHAPKNKHQLSNTDENEPHHIVHDFEHLYDGGTPSNELPNDVSKEMIIYHRRRFNELPNIAIKLEYKEVNMVVNHEYNTMNMEKLLIIEESAAYKGI